MTGNESRQSEWRHRKWETAVLVNLAQAAAAVAVAVTGALCACNERLSSP
jgi:hypothetical protein